MKKNIVKLLVLAIAVMGVMLAFASCGCSHAETEEIPAVEATCTEAGATAGTKCKLCGEVVLAPVATEATGHSYKAVGKVDATCTVDGHEAGSMCACGAVESGCEKIAAAHKPVDVAEKAATCTEDGVAAGKRCSACAEDLEGFAVIPATGHTLKEFDAIAPSCTVAGSAAGKKCENCDYSEGFDYVEATGHTEKAVDRIEPTCIADGTEAGKRCAVCDEVMEGCAPVPMLGHTNGEITVVTAPTLGVNGAGTTNCTVCQAPLEIVIPGIPGGIWDYANAEDTGLRLVDSNNRWTLTQKTEGDKTYAELTYVNNLDGGKYNEANLFWQPTTPLKLFTHTTKYVFETDMIINDITPTETYAANTFPWFFYLTLCDSESPSGDNNHVTNTCYILKDADGNPIITIDGKDTVASHRLPYQQWFNLKVVYTMDDVDANVYVEIYVNGEIVHTRTLSRTNKDGTLKFDENTVAFKLKFKNNSNFNSMSMAFDNSKFEELDSGILSVEEALALGATKEHDTYTADKYYVSGEITEVYNATYGNMKIKDANGNILTVYGTYSADGSTRYDAMETKPVVGDTVTVYGIVGQYNGTAQVKNGWIVKHTAHTHAYTDATCAAPATCTICGATEGEALAHTYVEGVCSGCGKQEVASEPVLAGSVSFADKANRTEYSTSKQVWAQNGVTVTNNKANSTSNVGDYSNPARFYASSSVTVDFAGMTKIVFNCNSTTYATALQNSIKTGTVTVEGKVVTVVFEAPVDTYTIASLGAQVRVDSIDVYK